MENYTVQWKSLIRHLLEKRGYIIEHAPGTLWCEDGSFATALRLAKRHTLLRPLRCFVLWEHARMCVPVRGEVAELGVYKGGSAKIIAMAFRGSGKGIHLFDTFSGMPAPDPRKDHPIHQRCEFNRTSLESVESLLREHREVICHAGLFPGSAQPLSECEFSYVHVDAVIYRSVRDACEFFYPRLAPGGVMIFDDYRSPTCPGATLAVDEFFANRHERPILLPTRQCVVHRLPDTSGDRLANRARTPRR